MGVCAGSSMLRGVVCYKAMEGRGFNGKTFQAFLRSLHNQVREPFAILFDNASYHGKEIGEVVNYCEKSEITIIRNVPYRPDFNGIEGV